ncbi:MAG: class B sortase [Clostridia bacterium]|nr:class B sortase [Clostridia bacterium]
MSDNKDFVNAASKNTDDFIDSLDSLKPDDVVPPHRKKALRADISAFKASKILLVLLCIGIFAYCISELYVIVSDYGKGEELYEELKDDYLSLLNGYTDSGVTNMILTNSDIPMSSYYEVLVNGSPVYVPVEDGVNKDVTSAKFQVMLAQIQKWRDTINTDTYGFINIPNTKISYPLVQCGDNDFYLKHGFNRQPLAVGAIFIDFRNTKNVEKNRNIIIYGHNMLNGSMFCDATKFVENAAFFMNTENDIEITTFDGHYTFRVFSAYPTDNYDKYFRTYFSTDEEFVTFLYEREAKSLYHREDISFTKDDVIITLSTCILGNEDGRYAVHAKLIKVEK